MSARLGRLYGPNEDRGVYKTTDGGQTWHKVLYVDDKTGVIDMVMHPTEPDTLIAALWDRQRDGFDSWPGNEVAKPDGVDGYDPIRKWGPGGGLFRTTDGGKTWKKLKDGLPTSNTGRIGLDWYRKDPKFVYAIIDCEDIGKGPPPLHGVSRRGRRRCRRQSEDHADSARQPGREGGPRGRRRDHRRRRQSRSPASTRCSTILRDKKVRDKVTLKVARGGEEKSLEAALTARPGQGGQGATGGPAGSRVWLGVTGEDRDGKATLTQIIADGPAAKAGLKEATR